MSVAGAILFAFLIAIPIFRFYGRKFAKRVDKSIVAEQLRKQSEQEKKSSAEKKIPSNIRKSIARPVASVSTAATANTSAVANTNTSASASASATFAGQQRKTTIETLHKAPSVQSNTALTGSNQQPFSDLLQNSASEEYALEMELNNATCQGLERVKVAGTGEL